MSIVNINPDALGWEFQFLLPISGTPIRSQILIPFLIPEIPVVFFWIPLLKNWQIRIPILKFGILKKKIVGTQYTSFCTRKQGCCHTYIYSKWLPPYLYLFKTVAAVPTSTQKCCRHTYIYSNWLPPYLHLLKTVAAIPTSTENGCCHTYIYSKQLPPSLHHLLKSSRCENGGPKKLNAGTFSNSWNWKNWWWERIPNWRERVTNWREHILRSEK